MDLCMIYSPFLLHENLHHCRNCPYLPTGTLYLPGGIFPGINCPFHEALPVCQMLSCKMGMYVGTAQNWPYPEPLSPAINGIRTIGIGVISPIIIGLRLQ